ncbi:MAG TPA: PadR family transcriptional regulator [Solirubrobacteraceae bacterium]|jgi:DNA-binding PadR family transcriptional regulator
MFSHEHEPAERGRCGPGHHHRHRRHGFGPGPFGDFGGPFGGWGKGPRGRGRKARRGDIRTAALLLLAEEPRNGYQIMQEVEDRSNGLWRPSPGSVYPALQQLEDEGLIRSEEVDGRKLFALTDAGRKLVEERGADRPAPWEEMGDELSDRAAELGKLVRDVAYAFAQVMRTGSEAQMAKAAEVLSATRRDLYRILADGDAGDDPTPPREV